MRATNFLQRTAIALLALGATSFLASANAQTGFVGILGGGPVYMHNTTNIKELKRAGFTELMVWSVEVKARRRSQSQRRISARPPPENISAIRPGRSSRTI